jgi:alkylation response protein AidB-like acyl-CoA dehydrogenase
LPGYPGVDAALISTGANDDDIRPLREALRRALGTTKDGLPAALETNYRDGWPVLAELGITAFCVTEDSGGFGFRVDAAVTTAMELGAALHGSPYAGLTTSAAVLATESGNPEAESLLSAILDGTRVCALGYLDNSEAPGRLVARTVDGADAADAVLLLERGGDRMLILTDPVDWTTAASGFSFDVTRSCADVRVRPGAGSWVNTPGYAAALHRLMLCADSVGGVLRMLDRTVAYTGQREAFGRAIGGLQAVQHRLVDHTVRARGMTLLVAEAARLLGTGNPQARHCVAMTEVSVCGAATHILHDLLQLTGAIGFTWEYGLHHYERRVHHNARLAANPRAATRSLSEIEGWGNGR